MKNLAKIFMAVVLLAGITSCVQDTTVDGGIFQPTTELTISVADANRTALGAKTDEGTYPVYWSNGDKVSVNGISSAALAVAEGATEQVKGVFEFKDDLGATPYKASYPATAEAGKVLFAAAQSYKEGTFSEGAAAMYGESETMTIEMKHAAGVLQFPIKAAEGEDVVLKRVVVTNVNGKLAGLYTAELIEGELALTPDATATSSISYDCGELALSTEPVKLHIAVPAGEYAELKVSLVSAAHGIMNFKVSATGEKTVKPGVVREFNKTTGILFSGNDATFQISDSESLMEFAKLCNEGGFAYSGAKVTADITFDDDTYDWVSVSNFTEGLTFDGGNHTITGLTDALFTKANGTIKDLTLNSTIEKGVTTKAGYGILANHFHGTINNCKTKGSFAVTSTAQDWTAVAGLVGWATGGITFINSTNEAAISVDNAAKRTYIAGLLGSNHPGKMLAADNPITFTNCHNTGAITSKENGSNRRGMAGFVGCNYNGEATNIISFNNCVNSGDVINKTIASDNHIAGFIGSDMGFASISNSANTGTIAIQGEQTETGNNYSIGGFIGYQTNTLTMTNCVCGATINQDGTHTKVEGCTISIETAPGGVRIGGLVGYSNAGADTSFTGCYNYATVSATGEHKKFYLGGVVGDSIIDGTVISDCHNYGVLYIANDASDTCLVGGIAGEVTKATAKIDGCTNNVDLTIGGKTSVNYYVGGVVGYSTAQVLNTTNNNDITFNGTATSAYYIGGVAGSIQSVNVFNLKNVGDLTFQGSLTTGKTHKKNLCAVDAPSIAGVVAWLGKSGGELCLADSLVSTGSIHLLPAAGATKSDSFCHAGVIGVSNNYHIKRAYFKKNAQGVAPSINITSNPTCYNSMADGEEIISGVVAAPFATVAGADIENCYNEGILNLNSPVMQNQHNMRLAGIAAHANQMGANGVIKNCVNAGQIIFGTNQMAGTKSMDAGGISGNANCNFEGCINRGTITFKNLAAPANYSTKNVWYSAGIGGIVGISSGKLIGCEDHGSIIAEANSLNPRTSKSWYRFGGLVGSASAGCDLVECVAKGKIEIDSASAMYDGIFQGGGLIGYTAGKTASAYIVKDCTVDANVSAPALSQVGLIMGNTYATAVTMYTPVAETDYPVMGCKIDGSFVRSGKELSDITESNFHEVIYSDVPTVETWVPVVGEDGITRYHGNYGVKTAGGESGDDL